MQTNSFRNLSNKRKKFIVQMIKNAMLPYEAEKTYYEMSKIGVFENEFEENAFHRFFQAVSEPNLVLDLACGDGRHTSKLAEKARFVVGVDLSPTNLAKAQRKLRNCGNIGFVRACMFTPPFRNDYFNGVWFSQAFEYVAPDMRKDFLLTVRNLLKPPCLFYMSVETWQDPSLWVSIKNLICDFRLFAYWKFIKRKPLLWGEFLYYLPPMEADFRDWHYHVHTSKRTMKRLLESVGMNAIEENLNAGYLYLLCYRLPKL